MRNYHAQIQPRKVRPYTDSRDEVRLEHALNAVGLIALADPSTLHPPRHRNLLAIAIDDLADVGGKKNARYRSWPVWEAQQAHVPIRHVHEHVVERKWLVERILADPTSYAQICLRWHATCLVTPEQDDRLDEVSRAARQASAPLAGWSRYAAAGIAVVDGRTGTILDLASAVLPEAGP